MGVGTALQQGYKGAGGNPTNTFGKTFAPPPPAPSGMGAIVGRAAAPAVAPLRQAFAPPPAKNVGVGHAVARGAAPAVPAVQQAFATSQQRQAQAAQAQAAQAQHANQLATLARVIATSMRSGQAAYNLPPVAARIAQTASQLGFNRAASAGLIGNATQESGLKANLNEGTGKGLFSWDPTTNPSEAAKVQLGNVDQQIRQVAATLGPQGIQAMNRAGGPEAAATWFEQNFERADPAQANMVRRTTAARQAYGA